MRATTFSTEMVPAVVTLTMVPAETNRSRCSEIDNTKTMETMEYQQCGCSLEAFLACLQSTLEVSYMRSLGNNVVIDQGFAAVH